MNRRERLCLLYVLAIDSGTETTFVPSPPIPRLLSPSSLHPPAFKISFHPHPPLRCNCSYSISVTHTIIYNLPSHILLRTDLAHKHRPTASVTVRITHTNKIVSDVLMFRFTADRKHFPIFIFLHAALPWSSGPPFSRQYREPYPITAVLLRIKNLSRCNTISVWYPMRDCNSPSRAKIIAWGLID